MASNAFTDSPTIATDDVSVIFHAGSGLPRRYDLTGTPRGFDAADEDARPGVLISRSGTESTAEAELLELVVSDASAHARYQVPGSGGIEFSLAYRVDGASLELTLIDVLETGPAELIQVDLPHLVQLDESHPGAWLAHADGGGVFSSLTEAAECTLPYGEPGDFPNLTRLPLVLLGHDGAALALEIQGYLSNTALEVRRVGGSAVVVAGATALHRVPGSATAPTLPVEQSEIARFDFVGPSGSEAPTWLDAARAAQANVRPRRSDYFDDKFMYAVLGQLGPADRTQPSNTFAQVEKLIARVAHLTDGAPQVVFVAGWNEGGHDTGYPAISTINPLLGGESGWYELQDRARASYATNVTLDDNYDDMYDNDFTEGVFDPAYLARDRDGSFQTQERWNGVDLSHIAGFAKYVAEGAPGLQRADVTIERYRVRDAMLIDAMSWWSVRNDWDPVAPASAVRNLREGKIRLLDHFRERGVQVGSEVLTYPFVGELPFTMDGPTGSEWNGFHGTEIPAMAVVYRKALIYGAAGGGDAGYPDPATALFHNNRAAKWLDSSTEDSVITGMYYLHYLPWMALSPLDIVGFERQGSESVIRLSEESSVTVDDPSRHATAVLRGETILDGRAVSIPIDSDRVAFYAETHRELSWPTSTSDPADWQVESRSAEQSEPAPFRIENGRLVVDVHPFVPVIARRRA